MTYKSDCMTVKMSRFMVNECERIEYRTAPGMGKSVTKKRCTWTLVVDSITTRYRPSFSPSGRTVRLSRAATMPRYRPTVTGGGGWRVHTPSARYKRKSRRTAGEHEKRNRRTLRRPFINPYAHIQSRSFHLDARHTHTRADRHVYIYIQKHLRAWTGKRRKTSVRMKYDVT